MTRETGRGDAPAGRAAAAAPRPPRGGGTLAQHRRKRARGHEDGQQRRCPRRAGPGAAAASAAAASSAPVAMCSTKIAITASTAGSAATCSTAVRKPAGDSAATSWTGPATIDCRRQHRAQRGLGLGGERRDAEARVGARVRADDARAAGVADDPDAPAARGRLLGEDGGGVEQVVEPVAADHARAGEQRVDGAVGGRDQRAGVRRRRPRARARPPRLDRQHRLGPRHPPRHAAELARVAEGLQVQRDDLGRGVLLPVLQDVVARQVRLVAQRDERATARSRGATCRRSPPPRTPRSGRRSRRCPTGTSARPNVPVSATAGSVLTTPIEFGPTSRIPVDRHASSSSASRAAPSAPASANPAVMTTSAGDARRGALARDRRHGLRRHGDDRQVDRPGRVRDRRRRAARADEVRVRVDRVELAAEAVVERVPERRAAEGVRPARGADHRDGARPQHPLDRRDGRDPVAILELAPRVLPQLGRELELDPVRRRAHVRPGSRTRGRR